MSRDSPAVPEEAPSGDGVGKGKDEPLQPRPIADMEGSSCWLYSGKLGPAGLLRIDSSFMVNTER